MNKILRGKIPGARLFTRMLQAAAVVCMFAVTSCNDDDDFSRSTNLVVYTDTQTEEAITKVVCRTDGGEVLLYVRSNAEYTTKFRTSADNEWVRYESLGRDESTGVETLRVTYDPVPEGIYTRRTGTISFSSPENYLGQFVVFSQGFSTRLTEKFDWLNTGSADPLNTSGELRWAQWTSTQQDKGWTSPLIDGEEVAYLYSKRGYVRLGDADHAAELATPDLSRIVSDNALMLSFKAVAYVDSYGVKDAGEVTVRIENGGHFADGSKQKSITVDGYNHLSLDLAAEMWDADPQRLFILADEKDPFTIDTRIVISTLRDEDAVGSNRIFIDNVYLYIIDEDARYMLEGILPDDPETV